MLPTDYHLQLVTDHKIARLDKLPKLVANAVMGGVNVVQLRDKVAKKNDLYQTGLALKALLLPLGVTFLVNDHIDIALALDADGVHIGQSDLRYCEARRMLGKNKIIGLTINTLGEAKEMGDCGADYFGVAPIFLSKTKPDLKKPLGFNGLKKICKYLQSPVIPIGGLQAKHVNPLLKAGATGIAIVSAILGANSPKIAAMKFVTALRCSK